MVLFVTYLSVAIAVVAYAGTEFLTENADEEEQIFAELGRPGDGRLGLGGAAGGGDLGAVASTQTTIIPASRTGLSMARRVRDAEQASAGSIRGTGPRT